jgi:hypothetical protein
MTATDPAARRTDPTQTRLNWLRRSIVALMVLGVGAFGGASAVHAGLSISIGSIHLDDPFGGAAVPEAIIAAALGIGAWFLASRRRDGLRAVLIAAGLSLLFTLYGLSVTLREGRTADVAYHVSLLALLVVIVALVVVAIARDRRLSGHVT